MAEIREISLDLLKIHPKNVRKEYDGIDELAQSIKENGIMQNLTVVPDPEEQGKYLVVIGNRRLTAARKAGIETAPCAIAENMEEKEQILTMLTENMNRKDLKIYEESEAVQMCIKDFGIDMDTMVEKTGLSKTTIYHRINIAKLNQNGLVKKINQGGFQLTMQDLYSLEQIKSVATRNRVLKEATSSNDLQYRVKREVTEEKRVENLKILSDMAKKAGFEQATDKMMENYYMADYVTLEDYYIANDSVKLPKKFKTKTAAGIYYGARYGTFYIFKKAEKKAEKKELTKTEREAKEGEKRKKEIKVKYKEIHAEMCGFVRDFVIEKNTKPEGEPEEIQKEIWELITEKKCYVSTTDVMKIVLNDQGYYGYDETEELRKERSEKRKSIPVLSQMIAVFASDIKQIDICSWDAEYSEGTAGYVKRFADVLSRYGFSLKDDEKAILDGTSELYTKKRGK